MRHIFGKLRSLRFNWCKQFQDIIITAGTINACVRPQTNKQTVTKLTLLTDEVPYQSSDQRYSYKNGLVTSTKVQSFQSSKVFSPKCIITTVNIHEQLPHCLKLAGQYPKTSPYSSLQLRFAIKICRFPASKWMLELRPFDWHLIRPVRSFPGRSTAYNSQWVPVLTDSPCPSSVVCRVSQLEPIVLMSGVLFSQWNSENNDMPLVGAESKRRQPFACVSQRSAFKLLCVTRKYAARCLSCVWAS